MITNKKIKAAMNELNTGRSDPRYIKTIGKLVAAHLLESPPIKSFKGEVSLNDALWAGQFEPRILELIPAIVLKKNKLFKLKDAYPDDLQDVIKRITHGDEPVQFRGVEPRLYLQWVERVGHKGKTPTLLKTFRFSSDDVKLMNEIKNKTDLKEIEIIRNALELFMSRI